jgi:LysM repeat protein
MPARLLFFMMLLPLCSCLSGCTPTAEGQFDEQNNPHYRAGKEKLSALDYTAAVASFERALEDNPRSVLAHFELGVLYEQQEHDYAAALYHYNKVLKLRPTGYPSENVRQRIPACRQELVKADSLITLNPAAFQEIQTLRATNHWLLRELELTRAQLAGRSTSGNSATTPGQTRRNDGSVLSNSPDLGNASSRLGTSNMSEPSRSGAGSSRQGRTYTVKAGDTLASIARQYGVRLESLQAANPGVNAKRLRPGQALSIPAP